MAARGQVLADFQPQQPRSQPRSWIAGRRAEEGNGDDGRDWEKVDQGGDRKEFRAGNCNDCNRQYCLDARLPICKDAGVNDVFTTCFREWFFSFSPYMFTLFEFYDFYLVLTFFEEGLVGPTAKELMKPGVTERDSRKDEAVVFIFIIATAGLLGWAAVKPWVGTWIDVSFLVHCGKSPQQ